MTGQTVRGDAVLLCVEPGGGEWRSRSAAERIAAGAVLAEAALRGIVSVERDRLRPVTKGDGALAQVVVELADHRRARKVSDALGDVGAWALPTVVQELAAAGIARTAIGRKWGAHREVGLEVIDRTAQDRAAQAVRDAVAETGNPTPEVAIVALLLGAAGQLTHLVPEAASPLSRFFNRPRMPVRRRLGHLRDGLPDGPRAVLAAYEETWRVTDRSEID